VGAAAVAAAEAWGELLRDLAGQLDEAGEGFAAAADGYAGCDGRAAARVDRARW
jgi:hypothetical protein